MHSFYVSVCLIQCRTACTFDFLYFMAAAKKLHNVHYIVLNDTHNNDFFFVRAPDRLQPTGCTPSTCTMKY